MKAPNIGPGDDVPEPQQQNYDSNPAPDASTKSTSPGTARRSRLAQSRAGASLSGSLSDRRESKTSSGQGAERSAACPASFWGTDNLGVNRIHNCVGSSVGLGKMHGWTSHPWHPARDSARDCPISIKLPSACHAPRAERVSFLRSSAIILRRMSTAPSSTTSDALHGLRVAFVGRLAGMPKREAQQLVRAHGGIPVEAVAGADLIVVADQSPPLALADVLEQSDQTALEEGRLVALAETQLWQQLGLIDHDPSVTRMYTPAMLAELLGVPVAKIRRWHENGLPPFVQASWAVGAFRFCRRRHSSAVGHAHRRGRLAATDRKAICRARAVVPRSGCAILAAGTRQEALGATGGRPARGRRTACGFDFDERSADEAEAHTDEPSKSVLSLDAGPPAAPAIVGPAEMIESAHALEESGQLEHAARCIARRWPLADHIRKAASRWRSCSIDWETSPRLASATIWPSSWTRTSSRPEPT